MIANRNGRSATIVTGGIAPNFSGRIDPHHSQLSFAWQVAKHRTVVGSHAKTESSFMTQLTMQT